MQGISDPLSSASMNQKPPHTHFPDLAALPQFAKTMQDILALAKVDLPQAMPEDLKSHAHATAAVAMLLSRTCVKLENVKEGKTLNQVFLAMYLSVYFGCKLRAYIDPTIQIVKTGLIWSLRMEYQQSLSVLAPTSDTQAVIGAAPAHGSEDEQRAVATWAQAIECHMHLSDAARAPAYCKAMIAWLHDHVPQLSVPAFCLVDRYGHSLYETNIASIAMQG